MNDWKHFDTIFVKQTFVCKTHSFWYLVLKIIFKRFSVFFNGFCDPFLTFVLFGRLSFCPEQTLNESKRFGDVFECKYKTSFWVF